jgi:TolB-like protein/DNA-binding SARP family transcriptional activator/Tfp pilus assembly protein PilF
MNDRRGLIVVANVNKAQNRHLQRAGGATGLRIRLLGPMAIDISGERISIPSKRVRALLGYLALRQGKEIPRSVLSGLLWGERSESQARASLRQALSELRAAFGALAQQPIVATKETVGWMPDVAWIDARVLETAHGMRNDELQAVADLIGGELMEGLSVGEVGFEQWLTTERERFRMIATGVFARLMQGMEKDGRFDQALTFGLKLLSLDPLQEHVHRTLMRLYAAQGRHDAALAQYEKCRRELSSQLGLQPEPETDNLAASIRTGRRAKTAKRQDNLLPEYEPHEAPLPSKPSIAVLPFANLSADPEQQYFSDGITEDIITELSRFSQLHVVARNSSDRYRGQDIDVSRASRELGVQYLVEGSVRRLRDRIRITAQLVDTRSGHHLWAERFDRDQEELFAVQDQVVRTIAATLVGRLQAAGTEQAKRKPPASLAAYECVLRGYALPVGDPEAAAEARRLFQKAIELDPDYARAYGMLAHSYANEWFRDMTGTSSALDRAFELAKKAAALGENDAHCQGVLGMIHMYRHSYELAEYYGLKALELNPNNPALVANLGQIYPFVGKPAEGLDCLKEAKLLDPFFEPSWYWAYVGIAHFAVHRYDEAIACLSRASNARFWLQAYLAACCALSDRLDSATQHAAEVVRLVPDFSLTRFAAKEPFKLSTDRQQLVNGLREAGLPE